VYSLLNYSFNKTDYLEYFGVFYNTRILGTRFPFPIEKILYLTIVFLQSSLVAHIAHCDSEMQDIEGYISKF
jgi:hypothetical protein